jgi:ATP-dependent DNA helicase RecG
MNSDTLATLLEHLIAAWESEVVEFKEAARNFETREVGKYFSALANEANLRGLERGWLIFGVRNATRAVVGTACRPEHERLHSLKHQMHDGMSPSMTFREIHELQHPGGRVVLLEIPAAPRGLPDAWSGHYYTRAGTKLRPSGQIRNDGSRGQPIWVLAE